MTRARGAGPLLSTTLLLTALLLGCALPFPSGDDAPPPPAPSVGAAPTTPAPSLPPATAPTPAAAPTPSVSATELQARKIAEYTTHCVNRFSERALSSRSRYLSWADEQTGPTGRERVIYGVYTVSGDAGACREAVQRAASMPPSMPEAERAADAYASAIGALQPLLARAETYYDRESYRDDAMAQGREMHGPLMAAYDGLRDADRALRVEVDRVQDAARQERLARMEHDPAQRTRYLIERTVTQALVVVRLARELRVEGRRYALDDPDTFVAAVETLRAGIDELRAHHPTEADQAPSGLSSFVGATEPLLESSLSCMRRVRDGEPFSTGHRGLLGGSGEWMVSGSYGQLQRRYNELVDAYNRLR